MQCTSSTTQLGENCPILEYFWSSQIQAGSFYSWNDRSSMMGVQEDQRGCPFGCIDFGCIPSCTRHKIKRMSFFDLFMSKFITFKSSDMGNCTYGCRLSNGKRWPPWQTFTRHTWCLNTTFSTIHTCFTRPKISLQWTSHVATNRWGLSA